MAQMAGEPFRVSVFDTTLQGTRLEVSGPDGTASIDTPAISPRLASLLELSLSQSATREDALLSWRKSVSTLHPIVSRSGEGPRVIVDNRPTITGDDLVAWGRILARLLDTGRKTVIVCGGVSIEAESDYDTLGALAASLIRLRLSLFIGVGDRAKALATQVGMEGSWDGESRWAAGPTEAYDYLCAETQGDDVVVFIGLDADTRQTLSDLLGVVNQ